MVIDILVRDKIASSKGSNSYIVCGNKDYTIRFDFDDEWDPKETKTAIFKWRGGYEEVPFVGTECVAPAIYNTTLLRIGVFAGDIRTSTDALIKAKKSTLCDKGVHHEPPKDVYIQLVKMIEDGRLQGDAGITPHIGGDGNWWIGEEDTGIKAEGKDYILTDTDKSQIVQSVLASLPKWKGGSY